MRPEAVSQCVALMMALWLCARSLEIRLYAHACLECGGRLRHRRRCSRRGGSDGTG